MLYSDIAKYGVAVTGERKRANGSGFQRYYVAKTDYDKCTQCSLRWGHRSACNFEDTVPAGPRGAKVAASASLGSGRIVKPKRISSHKKRTEVAGLLLRLRGEDSDSSLPPSPCQYLAVEVGTRFQPAAPTPPPPSPAVAASSMHGFLQACQLDSYTESMLKDGFDDVVFLATYERYDDNNLEKLLDSGDFPIIKHGHVMKLVHHLRKIPI